MLLQIDFVQFPHLVGLSTSAYNLQLLQRLVLHKLQVSGTAVSGGPSHASAQLTGTPLTSQLGQILLAMTDFWKQPEPEEYFLNMPCTQPALVWSIFFVECQCVRDNRNWIDNSKDVQNTGQITNYVVLRRQNR